MSEVKRKLRQKLPPTWVDLILHAKYFGVRVEGHEDYVAAVRGGRGLEIGGPSTIFKTILPVYQAAASVDGVNFAATTVWEGSIGAARGYRYLGRRTGRQFISDGVDLADIEAGTYDFVLSSNCLEHMANPLLALQAWKRVLRPGGVLVLVLPDKASNFDHRRPTTPFEHLVLDYESGTTERDMTHLEEILQLHDLSRDPAAGNLEQFRRRSLDNFNNRTLHHHVFEPSTIERMLSHAGFSQKRTSATPTDFYTLAVKQTAAALT